MKILLFTDSLGAGGAQRQLVGLAVLLKKKGLEVKVCTYYDIDFYQQYLEDNGIVNEIIPHAITFQNVYGQYANTSRKRILIVS